MFHLVNRVWKQGKLEKVIALSKKHCRFAFDLNLVETFPGESRLTNGLALIKKKVWKAFPSGWLTELLFDRYAASRLTGRVGNLVVTQGLFQTAKRAKQLGYRVFVYAATPDPRYLTAQVRAEQQAFGLKVAGEDHNRSRQMERFAAQLDIADFVIALSEFAKATYVQYGVPPEKIFVVPLGVDLETFYRTPRLQGDQFTYLLVAHVSGTTGILKGLPYLLTAWSELNLENGRLQICGEMGPEARKLIKSYGGKLRNVDFTGRVSNPELYYRNSSVFVLPSLAEGLPRVVLEAMACGRPVITTPIVMPVVRDGLDGFYVEMRDVRALKEKMRYFYDHRDEVARMGANAADRARTFTWQQFSKQMASLLSAHHGRVSPSVNVASQI
jgi:glycosyltransferase involved in cell wall biosynthesis